MPKFEFDIEDRMGELYTGGGGSSCLQLPSGLRFFKAPKAGGFRIEVIAFKAGLAVTKFDPELQYTPPHKWHWNCVFYQHGGVGLNNDKIVCPYCTFGRKGCPICEKRTELNRDPHPDARKAAKDLKPKKRQILLVSLRDERSGSLGPTELWEVATFNFLDQLQVFIDSSDPEDYEVRNNFWHPTKGLTVKVYGTEESAGEGGQKYTKYTVTEMKPRREPIPMEYFTEAPDLFSLVKQKPYDSIRQIFLGAEPDEGDADGEGPPERPAKGGYESAAGDSTPAPKKRPAPPSETKDEGAEFTPEVDDLVMVEVNGQSIGGRVVSSDPERRIAQVKVKGKDRPATFDWEEMKPVHIKAANNPDGDEEPVAKKKAPPAPAPVPDPDDDEEPEAPAPKSKAPASAKGGWDDDDDALPPPPKKKAK